MRAQLAALETQLDHVTIEKNGVTAEKQQHEADLTRLQELVARTQADHAAVAAQVERLASFQAQSERLTAQVELLEQSNRALATSTADLEAALAYAKTHGDQVAVQADDRVAKVT